MSCGQRLCVAFKKVDGEGILKPDLSHNAAWTLQKETRTAQPVRPWLAARLAKEPSMLNKGPRTYGVLQASMLGLLQLTMITTTFGNMDQAEQKSQTLSLCLGSEGCNYNLLSNIHQMFGVLDASLVQHPYLKM